MCNDFTLEVDFFKNFDLESICMLVNVDHLEELLNNADYSQTETKFLVDGFRTGFNIEYHGPKDQRHTVKNIPFLPGIRDKYELWQKIMKEVKLKRFAGPFEQVPFKHFVQSPIGLVPKAGGKTRLIFYLSYNFSEDLDRDGSINHFTPKDLCTVMYNDLDYAVQQYRLV